MVLATQGCPRQKYRHTFKTVQAESQQADHGDQETKN